MAKQIFVSVGGAAVNWPTDVKVAEELLNQAGASPQIRVSVSVQWQGRARSFRTGNRRVGMEPGTLAETRIAGR